jgi:hypothetical protein
MNIEQEHHWITGEEIGRENRRLIEAGIPDDAWVESSLWKSVLSSVDACACAFSMSRPDPL